jgi:chromosome segregation ATPase
VSEVPIKHFWATPTSTLDMTSLTNRIAELQAERDALRDQWSDLRDALRDQWSDLLIEQDRLMALRDEAVQQRDDARAKRDALLKEAQLYRAFSDGLNGVFGAYGDTIELCYVSSDAASLAVHKIAAAMEGSRDVA